MDLDIYNENKFIALKLIARNILSVSIASGKLDKIALNLGVNLENEREIFNLINQVIKSSGTYHKSALLDNPVDSEESIVYSNLKKAYHQFFGALIVNPNGSNKKKTIEIICGLINITDVIDTYTDSSREFTTFHDVKQIEIRNYLFELYINIFSPRKTDTELQDISDGKFICDYVKNECLKLKEEIQQELRLKFNDYEIANIMKLLKTETSSYVNGVKKMDMSSYQDWTSYKSEVASKSSNLAILFMIDILINNPALSTDLHMFILEKLRLLHADHIAQDDITDYSQDLTKNQNNIWVLFNKSKNTDADIISVFVSNVQDSILSLSKVLTPQYIDHFLTILEIKLELYYSRIDDQSLPDRLVSLIDQYYNKMKVLINTKH